MSSSSRRIRLCLKDLYHQDVVEMIERETRQFELIEICDPADPLFPLAYETLWQAFGEQGEMERESAIREFLSSDPFTPTETGTFVRYFFIVVRDREGRMCGVRDGTVLVNPAYADDLCVVFLSHLYMMPWARGTVASYWLRIAPVDVAVTYLADLHRRRLVDLPAPDHPGAHFGMRVILTAEMDYFAPEEPLTWQRLLFYGRGGFDVVDPRSFPYLQPDFREPELIRDTGNRPRPFMQLVRRMGRERQATMSVEEASAVMRLLYDDFATHCEPAHLATSLQRVMDRLARLAKSGGPVRLHPLPTGPRDLNRLRRLWRYAVYRRDYRGASPIVDEYLAHAPPEAREPRYVDRSIAEIRAELERREHFVYANRDDARAWDGTPLPSEERLTSRMR